MWWLRPMGPRNSPRLSPHQVRAQGCSLLRRPSRPSLRVHVVVVDGVTHTASSILTGDALDNMSMTTERDVQAVPRTTASSPSPRSPTARAS